ncbi:zinc finger protein 700-like [Ornithodoros turicata]|uniref:zinc finger protein 700-like n=1 Tax=Ornithodoros turicata TaxID=34597 RepID=UPI0031392C80
MEKGSLNAALGCPEGFYTNENVGKHVSALLQASCNSSSRFLPPYPLFPPLAPSGTLQTASDFSKRTSQHPKAPCSGMVKTDRRPKREPSATVPPHDWIQGQEKFSWDGSPIAAYNPSTKMFRCIACNTMGFLSRIAEHYLGTHVNAKHVFRCPECPYSSAWSRCVRLHLGKVHGIQNAPESLWQDQPLLYEITGILQNLKNSAEGSSGNGQLSPNVGPISEKRYTCPRCPYATDRRDLYHRHENIHKDDKPFHCYVCFKLFNRADHVKKHFLRIHKNHTYNISLIRRHPPRSSSHSTSSRGAANANSHWSPISDSVESRLSTGSCMGTNCGGNLSGSSNRCDEGTRQAWPFHSPAAAPCFMGTNPKDSSLCRTQGTLDESKSKRGKGSGSTASKTFSCAYCPWQGIDGWCLRRHLNTHIKPFTCPFCEYKAARSERLNTHVLKVHGKHLCNKCHFAGEDTVALERHTKEQHLTSSLNDKSRMGCSLYPPFPAESQRPTLGLVEKTKVKSCGCSGTSSTSCNTAAKAETGPTEQRGLADCVSSEFPCRLCGCLFADSPSLDTHLELAHGGPPLSPTFPYRCALCGFCSFTQMTMMEHMRLHTGQALCCRAWEGRCHYSTPFEDVLRNHVATEHGDDNAVTRCPHCGLPCSTTSSLLQHTHEMHHSRHEHCADCSIALVRHFGVIRAATDADAAVATNIEVQKLKQSRKQTKPRKVVVCCSDRFENLSLVSFMKSCAKKHTPKLWKKLYCRHCRLEGGSWSGRAFRCHSSYLIHLYWCQSKRRHRCSKCGLRFRHGYQSYLHKRKYHR